MPGLLEVVRREVGHPEHFVKTNIPVVEGNFTLRVATTKDSHLDAVVGSATMNPESLSFAFTPNVHGFLYEGNSLQSGGIYNVVPPTSMQWCRYSWAFKMLNGPVHRVLLPPTSVRPSEDDNSVVLRPRTKISPGECTGAVVRRNLLRSNKKFPLWLPGAQDGAGPHTGKTFKKFFSGRRFVCSSKARVAVSYPYGRAVDFLAAVTAATSADRLHLVNLFDVHSAWLQMAIVAASVAPNITSLAVEYGVVHEKLGRLPNIHFKSGNLQELIWMNIRNRRCVEWIKTALNGNLHIRHLAIGGRPCFMFKVLGLSTRRPQLKSLRLNLGGCLHIAGILDELQPTEFQLEELYLQFDNMPDVQLLLDVFSRYSLTLKKIEIVVMNHQRHSECSQMCHKQVYPVDMPALKSVRLENVTCCYSVLAENLGNHDLQELSVHVNKYDKSKLGDYIREDGVHPPKVTVQHLKCSPGLTAKNLMFHDDGWDRLRSLEVSDVKLMQIPATLKLGRFASKITITLAEPIMQAFQEFPRTFHLCQNGIADHFFVDNGQALSCLRDCKGLQELKIIFGTRKYDGWGRPTLGLCFYQRGLQHLPALKRFEANEIAKSLLDALDTHKQHNPHFSFEASLYSGQLE